MGPGRSPLWEEGASNLLHPPVALVAVGGWGGAEEEVGKGKARSWTWDLLLGFPTQS